jgi:thioredoxin 1
MRKILYFSAEWCGPCKQLAPIMESLQGEINYEKIDVDSNTELSTKYGIRNIPTLILVDNGNVIDKKTGIQSKQQILDLYNG